MARTQVQAELIATNAISGTIIADNAITATHIATNSISGVLVQDSGIVTTMIAANNVTAAKIVSDGVETRHLHSNVISGQSAVTAASGDYVLIGDTSDSNNLKKALVSDFGETDRLPLAGGTMTGNIVMGDDTSIGIGDSAERIEFDGAGDISILGGNFGVNSTSPATKFVVQHTDGESGIEFSMGASLNYIQSYDRNASDYIALKLDAEDLRFGTNNGTERMRILSDGKVGIGTTSPAERFQVNHTGVEASSIRSSATDNDAYFAVGNSDMSDFIVLFGGHTANPSSTVGWDDSNNLRFATYQNHTGTFGAERMRIDTNGNLGIGETAPHEKVHVTGASGVALLMHMDADTADGTSALLFKNDSTNDDRRIKAGIIYQRDDPGTRGTGDLHLCVNGVNSDTNVSVSDSKISILADGKVGIGTLTPSYGPLTVNVPSGDTRISFEVGGTRYWNTAVDTGGSPGSNSYWIGDAEDDNGVYVQQGGSSWSGISDERLKRNWTNLENATDKIKTLTKVGTFQRRGKTTGNWSDNREVGLSAQEVEAILPEAVTTGGDIEFASDDKVTGVKGMAYEKLVPLLVKSIQELEARIKTLEG